MFIAYFILSYSLYVEKTVIQDRFEHEFSTYSDCMNHMQDMKDKIETRLHDESVESLFTYSCERKLL
jgi:hypothetical protein